MTCMSFHPRSATVRAARTTVVLEMLRNVLDILQKNKTFRAELDRNYRERALETHLRSVPVLAGLSRRLHRLPPRPRRAGALLARPGDLPAGRRRPTLLPGAPRLREGQRAASRAASWCCAYLGRGRTTSARWACSAAACARRPAPRSTTSRSSGSRGEDFHADARALPGHPRRARAEVARERAGDEPQAASQTTEHVAARRLPEPGADGGAEPAAPRPRDVHALRRSACAPAPTRTTASRAWSATGCASTSTWSRPRAGRAATRSAWSAARSARSAGANSLEIIIEDWCIGCGLCAEQVPVRQHQPASVQGRRQDPDQPGRDEGRRRGEKATGCDLCTRARRAELRLRLPARRRACASSRAKFFGDLRRDARSPAMLIDRTHRRWIVALSSSSCSSPPSSTSPTRARRAQRADAAAAAIGLAYGIVGFAFMLFAGLLGAPPQGPDLAAGRAARRGCAGTSGSGC